jgi:hypothetical protein
MTLYIRKAVKLLTEVLKSFLEEIPKLNKKFSCRYKIFFLYLNVSNVLSLFYPPFPLLFCPFYPSTFSISLSPLYPLLLFSPSPFSHFFSLLSPLLSSSPSPSLPVPTISPDQICPKYLWEGERGEIGQMEGDRVRWMDNHFITLLQIIFSRIKIVYPSIPPRSLLSLPPIDI